MSRLRRIETTDRVFFVTTNLNDGVPPLSPDERDLLLDSLDAIRTEQRFFVLGYVVMLDHVHLLLMLHTESVLLPRIMHDWKFKTGYAVQRSRDKNGSFWQSRYFDFICRRRSDVGNKLEYIHENPVTAKLVTRMGEWPWSSAAFYTNSGTCRLRPDRVDMSGDPDELLWPAPWRRV